MTSRQRDIASQIKPVSCGGANAVAGTAPDGVEQSGEYVDRLGYESAEFEVAFEATLGDGETLTVIGNAQDAADAAGAGAADFGDAATSLVLTGGSGGTTEFGVLRIPLNLNQARRFIRPQWTADASAANTDVWVGAAVCILGGPDVMPAA